MPIIVVAFCLGRRARSATPVPALGVIAGIAVAATIADDLGQGVTMLLVGVLTVILPWLIGHSLRQQQDMIELTRERLEQVEATREAYAMAATAAMRDQLASDLHDEVGHSLALLAVQAGALVAAADGPSRADVAALRDLAIETTDQLRTVAGQLDDGDVGAPTRVSEVVERARRAGMSVTLTGESAHPVLVRATQEALTNAARHATGQDVQISCGTGSLKIINNLSDEHATGWDAEACKIESDTDEHTTGWNAQACKIESDTDEHTTGRNADVRPDVSDPDERTSGPDERTSEPDTDRPTSGLDGDEPAGTGLRRLRERVEAAGGHLSAGRDATSWRLVACLADPPSEPGANGHP